MNLFMPLVSAVAVLAAASLLLWLANLSLKKKAAHLEKEIAIHGTKLDYQKQRLADAANYFSSAIVIIMEMLGQINLVLKSEEENLSDKILEVIFEKAKDLFNPQKCILFKINPQGKDCSCLFSFGYQPQELTRANLSLDASQSFLGWAAATGRFFSLDEAAQDPLLSHLIEANPLKCHYAQPLKVDNQVKAVLCIGLIQHQVDKDAVVRLFSILSNIAFVALSNALLTEGLRKMSIRDSLSGLYNHSYFQKWLDTPLSRLKKEGGVLSLAMVDLDYFKKINDDYGHQAGDIILKAISGLLNSLAARDYICARYGGEEFALAFIGKDKNQTREIMEELRKQIAEKVFTVEDKQIRITISAGIAEARFPQTKDLSKKDLVDAADQALYKAKSKGKNSICMM